MNHAFLIQVHKEPELFGRIIKSLEASNHYFFINVDKKVDDKLFKRETENIRNVIYLEGDERKEVNWGGFSQIDCTLQLLYKVNTPPIRDVINYVHSISGQDYRCVSNEYFDKYFEEHKGESFMMYDSPSEHAEWSKPHGKYEYRYMAWHLHDQHIPNWSKIIIRKAVSAIEHIHYLRKPIANVHAGWSWFSWHRNVVEFVLQYLENHPDYLKRFHNTSCCDEIIFHTILFPYLKELRINPYNCLRYVDWHPTRPYDGHLPLTLNQQDFYDIVKSKSLFCRKVDENVSYKLMNMIDESIKKQA